MVRNVALLWGVFAAAGAAATAGIIWEPAIELTVHPSWSYVGYNNARCLVARGSELHVIWADYRYSPHTSEIIYRRSTDAGDTWLPFARVSRNPASSDYPIGARSDDSDDSMIRCGKDTSHAITLLVMLAIAWATA